MSIQAPPMSPLSCEETDFHMRRALELARQAIGLSDPNPRVGCVITGAGGRAIGEGHTQETGGPHAEVMAIRDALARGESLAGATAFVTLEPCAHHGRTPPCCTALVEAGIRRVVVALVDPNPLVAGRGIARMRQSGLEVITLPPGPLSSHAEDLNIGFFSRVRRGRPWVRLKAALSIDGKTALPNGESRWITSPAARLDGHLWRKRAGAVLTGVGTILFDDPRMDVRAVPTPRQPLRVIVDSRLRTPLDAAVLQAEGNVLIYATDSDPEVQAAFRRAGAEVAIALRGAEGRVELRALLEDLGRREINELHVEAGPVLNGSLIREGLVDEFLIYMSPMLLGPGRDFANIIPLQRIDDCFRLDLKSVDLIGNNIRIVALPLGAVADPAAATLTAGPDK